MFSVIRWLSQHWLEASQTGGIVGGFVFTALSLRDTRKAQKISNLFTLTHYHRELYRQFFDRPELRRIFRPDADLSQHPVTEDERLFLTLLILHVNLALEAMHMEAITPIEGLARDLAELFSKPIPMAVWRELRPFQNQEVVEMIDRLTGTGSQPPSHT